MIPGGTKRKKSIKKKHYNFIQGAIEKPLSVYKKFRQVRKIGCRRPLQPGKIICNEEAPYAFKIKD
jgi:hypothetical protein